MATIATTEQTQSYPPSKSARTQPGSRPSTRIHFRIVAPSFVDLQAWFCSCRCNRKPFCCLSYRTFHRNVALLYEKQKVSASAILPSCPPALLLFCSFSPSHSAIFLGCLSFPPSRPTISWPIFHTAPALFFPTPLSLSLFDIRRALFSKLHRNLAGSHHHSFIPDSNQLPRTTCPIISNPPTSATKPSTHQYNETFVF